MTEQPAIEEQDDAAQGVDRGRFDTGHLTEAELEECDRFAEIAALGIRAGLPVRLAWKRANEFLEAHPGELPEALSGVVILAERRLVLPPQGAKAPASAGLPASRPSAVVVHPAPRAAAEGIQLVPYVPPPGIELLTDAEALARYGITVPRDGGPVAIGRKPSKQLAKGEVMTTKVQMILDMLATGPKSVAELAKGLGETADPPGRMRVQAALSTLRKRGQVKHHGDHQWAIEGALCKKPAPPTKTLEAVAARAARRQAPTAPPPVVGSTDWLDALKAKAEDFRAKAEKIDAFITEFQGE